MYRRNQEALPSPTPPPYCPVGRSGNKCGTDDLGSGMGSRGIGNLLRRPFVPDHGLPGSLGKLVEGSSSSKGVLEGRPGTRKDGGVVGVRGANRDTEPGPVSPSLLYPSTPLLRVRIGPEGRPLSGRTFLKTRETQETGGERWWVLTSTGRTQTPGSLDVSVVTYEVSSTH